MTANKITLELPEKEWFTLQEVADRWTTNGGSTITPADILHYAAQGTPELCAYKPHYTADSDARHAALERYKAHLSTLRTEEAEGLAAAGMSDNEVARRIIKQQALDAVELERAEQEAQTRWFVVPLAALGDTEAEGSGTVNVVGLSASAGFFTARNGGGSLRLETADLRMTRTERDRFAQVYSAEQPAQTAPMTGELTPEAWKNFTPEHRREQASRRYQQLGNYAAVGREAGVSGTRIKQILKGKTPSINRTPPSDSPTIPGAWDTTNRATSRK